MCWMLWSVQVSPKITLVLGAQGRPEIRKSWTWEILGLPNNEIEDINPLWGRAVIWSFWTYLFQKLAIKGKNLQRNHIIMLALFVPYLNSHIIFSWIATWLIIHWVSDQIILPAVLTVLGMREVRPDGCNWRQYVQMASTRGPPMPMRDVVKPTIPIGLKNKK